MAFQILVARESSFCPGVSRAFRITEKTIFNGCGPFYSYGPLIHNPEVVERLRSLGLEALEPDAEKLPDLRGVPVVVRSHGIDTPTEERLKERGAVLVDATCPTVKHAQEEAARLAARGYEVVVIGSASHPEVQSIVGRTGAPVTVIESLEDAEKWLDGLPGEEGRRVGVVCQTTIAEGLLESVECLLRDRLPEVEVRDTICESVTRRQREATSLAQRADVMLVVGGKNSSNTSHLAATCAEAGASTHLVEDASEIRPEWFEGARTVAVTGGASTPNWQVEDAIERLRQIGRG